MSSDRLGEVVELDQYGTLIDAALICLGWEAAGTRWYRLRLVGSRKTKGGRPMQKAALVILIVSVAIVSPAFAIAPVAAKYCAQLRGAAGEKPDCTFKTLQECRASLKGKGGGHCYRLHHQ